MAFFTRNFQTPQTTSFTPLFRLLEDFDNYSRPSNTSGHHTSGHHAARRTVVNWHPKFDVR